MARVPGGGRRRGLAARFARDRIAGRRAGPAGLPPGPAASTPVSGRDVKSRGWTLAAQMGAASGGGGEPDFLVADANSISRTFRSRWPH